uniref:Pectate lyase n=1 Tax=Ambrosia artemisiifolia TaxID=4212 RepID=E1XUL2_AMBAR|nr:putative pectate lyase precursor [Ambrosia artemisiifolia]
MGIKHCCYILYFTLALVTLLQPVRSAEDLQEILPVNETRRLTTSGAYNIIDGCWRGKADWAENRKALADCAQGFGKGTVGGKDGDIYTVTSDLDDDVANPKEGTLRFGAAQNRPLWIIFERDMVIRLDKEMVVNSDKTIDGRGAKVEIINAGFTLNGVKNVIIHNINMHDVKVNPGGLIKSNDGPAAPRAGSDGDAISISGSSQIWIDHCSLSKSVDGLVDAKLGTTRLTVSNSLFTQHQFVLLFGAGDENIEDRGMLATVAFNTFTDNVDQRMPRCRHGFFQVVNNNYDKWGSYAIGGSASPTILSQGNRFCAPDERSKKNVLGRHGEAAAESMKWNWRTNKDVLENGAIFVASGVDPVLTPEQSAGMIPAEPGESALSLTSSAGVLSCQPGAPC